MLTISFADDAIDAVVSGAKSETLRVGEDFPAGCVVRFVRQTGADIGFLRILEKSQVLFRDLGESDVRTHNFKSLDELKARLLSIYPQLKPESVLLRYRFEYAESA